VLADDFARHARRLWAQTEPTWGNFAVPQSRVPLLPADLSGADVLELGCGTGYVSAWAARAGASAVGLDNSARQLATARRMQHEFGLVFPLVQADAECAPLADSSFDLVVSEYGASIWCDPYRWVPQAARVLRPGGRLAFLRNSTLLMLCTPDTGPVSDRILRPQAGLHRISWESDPGVEFHLGHGCCGPAGSRSRTSWRCTHPRTPRATTTWSPPSGRGSGPSRRSGSPAGGGDHAVRGHGAAGPLALPGGRVSEGRRCARPRRPGA
jgi:SAM-dependent methyltransferase